MTAGVPLHRRSMTVETFDGSGSDGSTSDGAASDGGAADGASLVVRARLRDERPWHPDPARLVLHDMGFELEIALDGLAITRADADMAAFPHTECPLIAPRFSGLVGLTVGRGFTQALRAVFGGVSGCSHLHELARATGPAVIQARMSLEQRRRLRGEPAGAAGGSGAARTDDRVSPGDGLVGSCHVWAPDGVAVRKLAAGWRPGRTSQYPAPPLEVIEATYGRPPA